MFGTWFGSEKKSAFDANDDLKPLFSSVKAIKEKALSLEAELNKDEVAQYKAKLEEEDRFVFQREIERDVWLRLTIAKQELFADLAKKIDEAITAYNAKLVIHPIEIKKAAYELVLSLQTILSDIARHWSNLAASRDKNRETADSAVHYGLVGSAFTTALLAPASFGTGLAVTGGAYFCSNFVRWKMGLSDKTAHSLQIINKFEKRLEQVREDLVIQIEVMKSKRRAELMGTLADRAEKEATNIAATFDEVEAEAETAVRILGDFSMDDEENASRKRMGSR